MVSKPLDRRKKYTRMVLKESLLELLQTKQIFTITVKEICERADVNRSTFYAHFSDQFELLQQIEDELIEDMMSYLYSYNAEKEVEVLQMTEKLIKYFATKKEVCLTLLSQNAHSSFEQKVRHVAEEFIIHFQANKEHADMFPYISAYIVSGSIEVMKVWLQNDMDTPPKKIAKLIKNLSEGYSNKN